MTVQPKQLQETAKQLGVSPAVLEQYFALKAAEVTTKEPPQSPSSKPNAQHPRK